MSAIAQVLIWFRGMHQCWPPRLGAPAAVGLVLLALACAVEWTLLPRWRAQLEDARAQAAASALVSRPVRLGPVWPAAEDAPSRTQALLTQAQRNGLAVQRTRERLDTPAASLLVDMQAQGQYVALRRFVETALAADPALALESLNVQRSPATATGLQFELQWRLLHQPVARPQPAEPRR